MADERLIFRRATPAETDALYGILMVCSAWLSDRGIDQWQPPYPRALFERDVAAGAVHLFETPAPVEPVLGTVTLTDQPPPYHPPGCWDHDCAAWYLSRFAVPRDLAGQGIGARLLQRLQEEAALAGVAALRLNCQASNPRLIAYYRAAGFSPIGEGDVYRERTVFAECAIQPRPAREATITRHDTDRPLVR